MLITDPESSYTTSEFLLRKTICSMNAKNVTIVLQLGNQFLLTNLVTSFVLRYRPDECYVIHVGENLRTNILMSSFTILDKPEKEGPLPPEKVTQVVLQKLAVMAVLVS